MPNIAADSFYARALPPTDDAARLTVDVAKKGHVNISVYNTSRINSARWSGYIKRAADGNSAYFALDDVLLPGQSGNIKRMLNLSGNDEVHVWGDSSVHCFIDGGIES